MRTDPRPLAHRLLQCALQALSSIAQPAEIGQTSPLLNNKGNPRRARRVQLPGDPDPVHIVVSPQYPEPSAPPGCEQCDDSGTRVGSYPSVKMSSTHTAQAHLLEFHRLLTYQSCNRKSTITVTNTISALTNLLIQRLDLCDAAIFFGLKRLQPFLQHTLQTILTYIQMV